MLNRFLKIMLIILVVTGVFWGELYAENNKKRNISNIERLQLREIERIENLKLKPEMPPPTQRHSIEDFEVFDQEGNRVEDIRVYQSPNEEYYLGLHYAGYRFNGTIAFIDIAGTITKQVKLYDFECLTSGVIFLQDGDIIVVVSSEQPFGGISFIDSEGNILNQKLVENGEIGVGRPIIIDEFKSIINPLVVNNERIIESYSFNGEINWSYSTGENRRISWGYESGKTLIIASSKLTKRFEVPEIITFHLINIKDGKLIRQFDLPVNVKRLESYEYLPGSPLRIRPVKNRELFIVSSSEWTSRDTSIRGIAVLDYYGNIKWKKIAPPGLKRFYGDFKDENTIIIEENGRGFLYEIKN